MRNFVSKHPHLTQFFVLFGVIVASIPSWVLVWFAIAEAGRVLFVEGCQARGYSCYYEGNALVIATLVGIPFFFYFFVYVANKISGWITDRILRWAGLNPKVALM